MDLSLDPNASKHIFELVMKENTELRDEIQKLRTEISSLRKSKTRRQSENRTTSNQTEVSFDASQTYSVFSDQVNITTLVSSHVLNAQFVLSGSSRLAGSSCTVC
ncbi:hypothetical protein DL93DRAFT_1179078 [Clavulina sp. PMI_390]|nr:hypothetical protein DL93DRAFT_1179078 [Clavulina sp. PMI_390]